MTFESWFHGITGQSPYPYQVALATSPALPDLLSVPTGAGKTAAAVLGWLWRRRFGPPALRACDLEAGDRRVTRLANLQIPGADLLPAALPGLIAAVTNQGLFADPPITRATFGKPDAKAKPDTQKGNTK